MYLAARRAPLLFGRHNLPRITAVFARPQRACRRAEGQPRAGFVHIKRVTKHEVVRMLLSAAAPSAGGLVIETADWQRARFVGQLNGTSPSCDGPVVLEGRAKIAAGA
ncbi:MAG: hypothetical protein A3G76_07875 [Acidobacteria bacterium RIFCSPLOWO2_12_FULL_65_11]|nr:MAG: hypothetical protein A3H95_01175 [Acidobacteria bacterium RIFCSPLOWO2_02_FULL_64_15]OFW31842.1 MAG: hypothetical protein A3G76_07875 [Acidobacteria bacterium RIFCSPLOWO2_12_FULL_65_11]